MPTGRVYEEQDGVPKGRHYEWVSLSKQNGRSNGGAHCHQSCQRGIGNEEKLEGPT